MCDTWHRFTVSPTPSASSQVLSYIIDDMNIEDAIYVKMSDIEDRINSLSEVHWMPSYIVRYIRNNLTSYTGLNIKYKSCEFCGDHTCVFTCEARGGNEIPALCSDKCRKYWRIKTKCSKSFFKSINKRYKESGLTLMLFAMQRRQTVINKLNGSK